MYIRNVAFSLLCALFNFAYASEIFINNSDSSCNDQSGLPFCTITAAIKAASENDKLFVATGEYQETFTLNKNLKIVGDDKSNTIINALGNSTVVTIEPGVKASLSKLKIINGNGEKGGGILNRGSLLLSQCIIAENTSQTSGGGIYNASSVAGSLVIHDCVIENNSALGEDPYKVKYGGGGIFNHSPMEIANSKINNNHTQGNGGGIYSIFAGRKQANAGQIYAEKLGIAAAPAPQTSLHRPRQKNSIRISRSQVTGNTSEAGGGIFVKGVMTIQDSLINGNRASLSRLSSGGGLFVHLDTILSLENVVINQNTASFRGGGMRFYSIKPGSMRNVSIVENEVTQSHGQGAGIFVIKGSKQLSLTNSIIAKNTIAGSTPSDCHGKLKSDGYNFVSYSSHCIWQLATGDIFPGEGQSLQAFINWDDAQKKYEFTESSPIINSGDPANCIKAKADSQMRCDIGAKAVFEF